MEFKRIQIYQIVTAIVVLTGILVLSSGAIKDGDYWWQIAYGRYMLENGTLIPDHSIFSWTETNKAWIYCAWLAEIVLYAFHQAFGILGGAFLRYASMLAPAIMLLWLAKYRRQEMDFSVWFYLFLCYSIARHAGGLIKPELFSHMLFVVLVGLYFATKSAKAESAKLIYITPLVLLVWINTHAGFIVGMFFIAVVVVGELLNLWMKSESRLSDKQWRAVGICVPISVLVFLSTPYGYHYPVQLIGEFVGGDHETAYQSVTAYRSIYSDLFSHFGVRYFAAAAVLLLIVLFIEAARYRRTDFALILINIVFFSLSATWGRFSYFSPVLMLFTFAHLIDKSEFWNSFKASRRAYDIAAVAGIVIVIGTSSFMYVRQINDDPRGPAFGPGYLNPVSETNYIRSELAGIDVCNGYNGGGYLLWALAPSQKVMIDPRYFPYSSWYEKWSDIERNPKPMRQLESFECRVWVVNHVYENIITALIGSNEWAPVFMGAAAVVFIRKEQGAPVPHFVIDNEVATLRSLPRTAHILNSLLKLKEYELAKTVSEHIRTYWQYTVSEGKASRLADFIGASIAYQASNDKVAYPLYKTANQTPNVLVNANRQRKSGQFLTELLWSEKRYVQALEVSRQVLGLRETDVISLYNTGFLQLLTLSNSGAKGSGATTDNWKQLLQKFVDLTDGRSDVPQNYIARAKRMIAAGEPENARPLVPARRPEFTQAKNGSWNIAPAN